MGFVSGGDLDVIELSVTELRAVYAAVSKLSAEERLALVLHRVEGMELSEVAEHMQVSLSTVKRRLALAERHLQHMNGTA